MYSRPPEARGYKWSEMHSQANPASKISDLGGPLDVSYCSCNNKNLELFIFRMLLKETSKDQYRQPFINFFSNMY